MDNTKPIKITPDMSSEEKDFILNQLLQEEMAKVLKEQKGEILQRAHRRLKELLKEGGILDS